MKLIRAEIFPEEQGQGFKGRLMRLNGVTDDKIFNQMLLQWAGCPGASPQQVPIVELLAAAAGIEPAAFVQQHSLLPLRHAIVMSGFEHPHGARQSAGLLWTSAFRMCRPEVGLCEECVSEDIDFHGMPYWRREHQVSGRYWCAKHRRLLRFVRDERAFLLSPTECLEHGACSDAAWAESLQHCPAIERFLAIASDLLHRQHPLSCVAVSRSLRDIAIQRGFHYGHGEVRGELLSDFLLEVFDRRWLSGVIRNIEGKVFKKFCPTIDRATSGSNLGISSSVFIAAFAALFDDIDEAIAALARAGPAPRVPGRDVPAILADADSARRIYVEFRGSYQGVAKALGVERHLVANRLMKFGLPGLGKRSIEPLRELMTRFGRDGLSVDWACNGDDELKKFFETYLRSTTEHLLQALDAMCRSAESRRRRCPDAASRDSPARKGIAHQVEDIAPMPPRKLRRGSVAMDAGSASAESTT